MRRAILRWTMPLFMATTMTASMAGTDTDIANIRNLSGCFEVTYEFVEDGVHDTLSSEHELGPVTEWVGYRERADGTLVLPHVSVTDDGRAVPHWHEIWRHDPASGEWTQTVRRGAPGGERDTLRYRCTAPWQMNRWQCHAGRAPKPFRDSGAPFGFDRTDYDWLDRENILLVTEHGWVHNEHNRKMTADGNVVAHELGWITYLPADESRCTPAMEAMPEFKR